MSVIVFPHFKEVANTITMSNFFKLQEENMRAYLKIPMPIHMFHIKKVVCHMRANLRHVLHIPSFLLNVHEMLMTSQKKQW